MSECNICNDDYGFKVLPRFELGTQGSKPCVLNHYTIRPIYIYIIINIFLFLNTLF